MKLPPSFENQEDIPEGLADYYAESGGKFVLQVEGITNIEGLDGTLKKELGKRKEAEKKARELEGKLSQLGDRDVDEVLKELDEIEELRAKAEGAGGGENEEAIQKRIDAAVKRATGPLERDLQKVAKERDEATEKAGELEGTLHKGKVDTALRDAAQKLKVRQEAVPDILLHGFGFEVSEDGEVRHKETQDTPEVYLTGLKDDRPHWWPNTAGGGASGNDGKGGTGGGANPFAAKAWNLSEVNRISAQEPDKAKRLARIAGYDSPEEAAKAAAVAAARGG